MTRTLILLLVAITAAPAAARASDPASRSAATSALRHSGTVVKIDPDHRAFTIQEVVSWTGTGSGIVERTVTVTEATTVELVVRDDTNVVGSETPGFREEPSTPSRLAPGDFVTVTTRPGRSVAVSIEVWRPRPER